MSNNPQKEKEMGEDSPSGGNAEEGGVIASLKHVQEAFQMAFNIVQTPKQKPDPFASKGTSEELLEKMERDLDKLHQQADEVYAQLQMSKEDIAKFVENHANFKPEEWEIIQQIKGDINGFQDKVKEQLGVIAEEAHPAALTAKGKSAGKKKKGFSA